MNEFGDGSNIKLENVELNVDDMQWNIFPMQFKSPQGNVILEIKNAHTFVVNGSQTTSDAEIGRALTEWADQFS